MRIHNKFIRKKLPSVLIKAFLFWACLPFCWGLISTSWLDETMGGFWRSIAGKHVKGLNNKKKNNSSNFSSIAKIKSRTLTSRLVKKQQNLTFLLCRHICKNKNLNKSKKKIITSNIWTSAVFYCLFQSLFNKRMLQPSNQCNNNNNEKKKETAMQAVYKLSGRLSIVWLVKTNRLSQEKENLEQQQGWQYYPIVNFAHCHVIVSKHDRNR